MKIDSFDYQLPEELIAEHPAAERDGARLLVVRPTAEGGGGATETSDRMITDLPALLPEGALLIVNDTRVLPARLFGTKPSGGRVELLLIERDGPPSEDRERWTALARASKPLRAGLTIAIDGGELQATLLAGRHEDGHVSIELVPRPGVPLSHALERAGKVPLPPYIRREAAPADRERYQTIFARNPGAVAAPTAGLHLSDRVLAGLGARKIAVAPVTLHVSLGTFQPVKVADLDDHPMHEEAYSVSHETAQAIASARERGAPLVALGTTSLRALESAADPDRRGYVVPRTDRTRLLIQPGYDFRVVDMLITNFHLPRSTLLALVSAFGGYPRMLDVYREAIAKRYRFFSYGDAMLIAGRAAPGPTAS